MGTEYVLAQFATTLRKARNAYRRFMTEGLSQGHVPEFTGGGLIRSHGGWSQVIAMRRRGQKEEADQRILGGGDFVESILREADDRQVRQLKHRRAGKTINKVIEEECKKQKVSIAEVQGGSKRRKVSATRAGIACRSMEELGLTAAEIARHLGVNTSSITRAIERAERQNENRKHK